MRHKNSPGRAKKIPAQTGPILGRHAEQMHEDPSLFTRTGFGSWWAVWLSPTTWPRERQGSRANCEACTLSIRKLMNPDSEMVQFGSMMFLNRIEWNWNVDKWSMCLILAHACDLVSFLPWLQATAAKARKAEQANSKPKLPPTDRPGSQGERGTRWLQVNAGRWKIWACSVWERERYIYI